MSKLTDSALKAHIKKRTSGGGGGGIETEVEIMRADGKVSGNRGTMRNSSGAAAQESDTDVPLKWRLRIGTGTCA